MQLPPISVHLGVWRVVVRDVCIVRIVPVILAWICAGIAAAQPTAPTPMPAGPAALRTVAEASDFQSTSSHEQAVAFLDALAKASPDLARRVTMGNTREGREMPVIILSDPPVATAREARDLAEREGRAVVLLFGNIHAGEVDAKEALCVLARELALRDHPSREGDFDSLLKQLVIAIAPIYNADGNDRFGPIEVTRPGQAGPANGAGTRHNAMDLDLNRDWCKLESPEARAMVRFFNEWDPNVVVDGHTTDGSYHRYLMTYAGPKVPAGDPELIRWTRDEFFPRLDLSMKQVHGIDTFFYGDFAGGDHDSPPRQYTLWDAFPPQARYSTGYIGLRGRIGILSESYSYSSFRDRIAGTRALCIEVLRSAAANRSLIRTMTAAADVFGAGGEGRTPREVALRAQAVPAPGKVTLKGYLEKVVDGKLVSTNEPLDREVELLNRYEATRTTSRPSAYVFLEDVPEVIENLAMHGIRVEHIAAETQQQVELLTVRSVANAPRPWQGHTLATIEVDRTLETITMPRGAAVVLTDQPLGSLAIYLLEPECDDGLPAWNFFDRWLQKGTRFPVARVLTPIRQTLALEPTQADQ